MKRNLLITGLLILVITNFTTAQEPTWFKNITHDVGLDSARGSRVAWVDVNNDNYPDILWGTGNIQKNRHYLFLNVPDPERPGKRKFIDFTEESNMNQNRNPEVEGRIVDVAGMADVDNDGDMDLVTTIYYHRYQNYNTPEKDPGDRTEVLLNDGTGRFTMVMDNGLHDMIVVDTFAVGLINATGMAFLDYDYDGNIDIYIPTWFTDYKANLDNGGIGYKMNDILVKGNGDGSFTKIEDPAINNIVQPMYGVNVTDWDNDGWQDIFTNAYCRSGGSLFKNQGGSFIDATAASNYSGQKMGGDHGQALCNWESLPGDFDNDGDMDLLQVSTHGGNDDGEGRTHVTINRGPSQNYRLDWDLSLLERDAPKNTTHFGDQGGCWFDMDADGKLDIAVGCMGYEQGSTNMQGQVRLYMCRQNDQGVFKDVSKALGIYEEMKSAHSMESGDFDLDGDQDFLFSRQIRDTLVIDSLIDGEMQKVEVPIAWIQVTLLRNDIGTTKNWTSVKLTPPAGINGSALGARIYVYADGLNQIAEIQAAMGHFGGMQPFIRNFGLDEKTKIDSIAVRWPGKDLKRTVVVDPPINTILEIDENGLAPHPMISVNKDFQIKNVAAGESDTKTFDITNIGQEVLHVSNIELIGDTSGVFDLPGNVGAFDLSPGESKSISVQLSPMTREKYYANVRVVSNSFYDKEVLVHLYGTGFEPKPVIAYDKIELDYGTIFIGESKKEEVEIRNRGEETLNITGLTLIDDENGVFNIETKAIEFSLESGEAKKIEISLSAESGFKYSEDIEYSGKLAIESNAFNTDTSEIQLFGLLNGPAPQLDVNRTVIFLTKTEVGDSIDYEFKIANPGNAMLNVKDMAIEEDVEGVYTFPGLEIPFEVAPEEEKAITLRFKPLDAVSYNYSLVIITNAYIDSAKEVQLRGAGKEPADVAFDKYGNLKIGLTAIPNPVNDLVNIEIHTGLDKNEFLSVQIYDMYGNKALDVFEGTIPDGIIRKSVNMNSFASGMYYIIAKSGSYLVKKPLILVK